MLFSLKKLTSAQAIRVVACNTRHIIIYCNIFRVYVSFTDILFTLSLNVYAMFTLTWCLSTLALPGPL